MSRFIGAPHFEVDAWAPVDVWRTTEGDPGFVEWAVWEIFGVEDDGTLLYEEAFVEGESQGGGSEVMPTRDRSHGVRTAHGTVKWDGCCNFLVNSDEDQEFQVMLHVCSGREMALLGEALVAAYEMSVDLLGAESFAAEKRQAASQ